ncbi:conserved hypothetical protein [Talaromyces stipitatus ATCC 10500]|uniref:Uncharacterized protein n=1 Tax=Talaromyces stipitatus (strain ATCC 10500 / CBS 375.48 / QM 6759 / NRRL 1006) TaxID=441959 RepID=B8MGI9_TALSN|nr:uncharacterized protein TSTA_018120 [Talaromyces stipitatus ATCC 10500]EED16740.1 conserved hypothetical protein [Talaromyces stipitatus ATCC 10500]
MSLLLRGGIRHLATMGSRQTTRIELPGYSLRLDYKPPKSANSIESAVFPNALDYADIEGGYVGHINTKREIIMMQLMDAIAEKPEWDRKVFDEEITSKWRNEILNSDQDVTPKMMDWIVKEMQWKAGTLKKDGLISVFDIGVVRSDSAVNSELRKALLEAVAPLEDVPDNKKDYHPGSDMKVVDLVHPSLFPVVYGRTRILPDRLITVEDCLDSIGQGELLPIPSEEEAEGPQPTYGWRRNSPPPYSRKFQWLPCDVKFTDEGGCRIVSYINNVHPVKCRPLYSVVERIIASAIPLWDESLTERRSYGDEQRIPYTQVEYLESSTPEPEQNEEDGDNEDYWERYEEWERSRPIKLPEPGEFKPPKAPWRGEVRLRDKFREKGLQVIVKLANIELTPEKPEYDGGSWHIEGQLNERICATAIYYYDSMNITESRLAFRQRASSIDDVHYPQGQHEFLQAVYGFGPEVDGYNNAQITQDLGSVVCREGRLVTFPNILQHQVAPFALADRSKPGHRKILALFLIDPHLRIISSANVPPQQEEWDREWQETVHKVLSERLPAELQNMVAENITSYSMNMDEAKEYRLELMEERSATQAERNTTFETGRFSLCEH